MYCSLTVSTPNNGLYGGAANADGVVDMLLSVYNSVAGYEAFIYIHVLFVNVVTSCPCIIYTQK